MNKIILAIIFLFAVFPIFGERNVLYNEIQQVKNSNVRFENVALIPTDVGIKEVLQSFINSDEVFFFDNIHLDINDAHALRLTLPTRNKNIVLELVEAPETFYDYNILTSVGDNFPANRDIRHYRGIVQNENNSVVAATFYKDEIIGLICTDEGNFNIAKDSLSGKYIFYNEKNLREQNKFECGTKDDFSFEYDTKMLLQARNNLTKQKHHSTFQASIDKEVKFYVETEYDIYQNKSSVSLVEVFISSLFNQVAVLYQNEDILTHISQIYV